MIKDPEVDTVIERLDEALAECDRMRGLLRAAGLSDGLCYCSSCERSWSAPLGVSSTEEACPFCRLAAATTGYAEARAETNEMERAVRVLANVWGRKSRELTADWDAARRDAARLRSAGRDLDGAREDVIVTAKEGRSDQPWCDAMNELLAAVGVTCDCLPGGDLHEFGVPPGCEYHDHHCESCHAGGFCTKAACQKREELCTVPLPHASQRRSDPGGAASACTAGASPTSDTSATTATPAPAPPATPSSGETDGAGEPLAAEEPSWPYTAAEGVQSTVRLTNTQTEVCLIFQAHPESGNVVDRVGPDGVRFYEVVHRLAPDAARRYAAAVVRRAEKVEATTPRGDA